MKATSCTYRLPRGYSVSFAIDGPRMDCFWSPEMPTAEALPHVLPAYTRARDSFLKSHGVKNALVEPLGKGLARITIGNFTVVLRTDEPQREGDRV